MATALGMVGGSVLVYWHRFFVPGHLHKKVVPARLMLLVNVLCMHVLCLLFEDFIMMCMLL